MDVQRGSRARPPEPSRSRPLTNVVTTGAAGVILVLGAGAGYLLTRAGPEALAATARALLTTGLIGLLTAAVVAMHLTLTARRPAGGHGPAGEQPIQPVIGPPVDDVDAEFFRIVDRELRDIWTTPPDRGRD